MGVKIDNIDESNYDDVLKVTISKDQENFVAPVVKSLADAWLYRDNGDVFPYAITYKDKVVGFILLEMDSDYLLVWRLLIDKNNQGQGYGIQSIKEVMKLAQEKKIPKVQLNYVKNNIAMQHIANKLRFKEVSFDTDNNEVECEIIFK